MRGGCDVPRQQSHFSQKTREMGHPSSLDNLHSLDPKELMSADSSKTSVKTSIAPWLSSSDNKKAIAFYESAFGATVVYCLDSPEGGGVVRLSVGGAEFWLSEEPDAAQSNPAPLGAGTIRMILTVANPDAVFAQALKAGATEVFPVGEGHGWRLGRLIDPLGLHWEIGYQLAETK